MHVRMFTRALLSAILLLNGAVVMPQAAQPSQSGEAEMQAKIRKEAMENSQIMRTLHYFTDVYGPRLTGSPNHKAAADWAVQQMTSWGLSNAHLEPWNFGHDGWLNERTVAHIVSPIKEPLSCEVLAWTPSTNGTITAQVYQLVVPENPNKEALDAFFAGQQDKVKGKIVLVGKQMAVGVRFTPNNLRVDEQAIAQRMAGGGRPGGGGGPRPANPANAEQPKTLTATQVAEALDEFLLKSGALARANDGAREHRQIRAFNNRSFDPKKVVPTVILSNEDFGRITRILADGTPVQLELNIVNKHYPEGRTSYNTIGELPGTDKKDEVIMLGGHLDSWHAATGATDNAIGCAMMMEALRILKTLGVQPRRTIRVALWSGEEQGLLGSQAYVKEHFGTAENPKPEFFKFGGYFNIDSGTGRPRAASIFGPEENIASMREALKAFSDFGFVTVGASRSRGLGGSDHTSFNAAGLPGIGLMQDPIEYGSHTWHTNLDTYERIVEDDVKKAAAVIASAVYHLAMRETLLARFPKDQMPEPVPARN
jgi:carboxypeptidase Q